MREILREHNGLVRPALSPLHAKVKSSLPAPDLPGFCASQHSLVPPQSRQLRIDSHAHVFTRHLPIVPGARHAPDYDALLETYFALLDAHGITHALLTAPSFLGTDNSYLLGALARSAGRLRGTVIVDPRIERKELDAFAQQGVVGIRLNYFRAPDLPDFGSREYRQLFAHVRELDWHVEIYLEGPRLAYALPLIAASGAKVVIDHFGSPDPKSGLQCAGFLAVLAAAAAGRTWIKLSAPYRLGGADAKPYATALLRECGPERLLWGSDWPWTQNAAGKTYALTLEWLDSWVPDIRQRQTILGQTPGELFGFSGAPQRATPT